MLDTAEEVLSISNRYGFEHQIGGNLGGEISQTQIEEITKEVLRSILANR